MAECDVSIDKNKLPGVKEVCKDFAVLEDHCLAYNLQEQEIESHLASNVNKSRLVQKDLLVAKKLQEEEDLRAKGQNQKQHTDMWLSERQDNEIAQEIQDQLVRQAEQQRQQEEKDAAIARKLQEKEMKEEKKRQKQLEANFEEEYFEDHGGRKSSTDSC
ncbi:Coiled-coil domain-containing protein 50 [Liparis tanakae]|uniref:Coiled-coil domain-containing protein 50 n=1 Tax=Liparis tanakae TaxID=230148 RepID=A0A4Z2JHJ3_9TELE|nr:Coiled-coil domain-containing protein 50 [Liparis tanakae]